jgi:hypothetical protein
MLLLFDQFIITAHISSADYTLPLFDSTEFVENLM